ncbi:mrpl-24, partial [Pristionchus pacificus]
VDKMWLSPVRHLPRIPSSYLDYSRHMPKKYVDRMKRTIPKKVFGGRFGAPDVVEWKIHPDDYVETGTRPWEQDMVNKNLERENRYSQANIGKKFYELKKEVSKKMDDEKWHIFVGDRVQVMVGKEKGKQGTVIKVSRDTSEVWVENVNCVLEEEQTGAEKFGIDNSFRWKEKPLSVVEAEVMLVDPNDEETCTAQWVISPDGSEYLRKSTRSGFEIPIPSQALMTYEYIQPEKYIEVSEKDTPSSIALTRTYVPKLATFAEEINEHHGISTSTRPHSYWY